MRPLIAIVVALVLVCAPCTLLAQDTQDALVPKLELTDCAPEYKCLDLEGYRRYLLMRAHYTDLYAWKQQVPTLVAQLKIAADSFEAASKISTTRAERAEAAYDGLFPKYVAAVQQAERAQRMSIFGGALPWLITIGTACLAAGVGVGVWASAKLRQ